MVRMISNMHFLISYSDKFDKVYGFNNNLNYSSCKFVNLTQISQKDNYLVYKCSPENFVV
jgi:hypothetical protein